MASDAEKAAWVEWLERYGADKFFDAFVRTAQGAESTCMHCGQTIRLDIVVGGGVPDWAADGVDFGCSESPDTGEEGTGSHEPIKGTVS